MEILTGKIRFFLMMILVIGVFGFGIWAIKIGVNLTNNSQSYCETNDCDKGHLVIAIIGCSLCTVAWCIVLFKPFEFEQRSNI